MSAAKKSASKVVLAYSGGLDTSCIVPWLVENYGCEVICFCALEPAEIMVITDATPITIPRTDSAVRSLLAQRFLRATPIVSAMPIELGPPFGRSLYVELFDAFDCAVAQLHYPTGAFGHRSVMCNEHYCTPFSVQLVEDRQYLAAGSRVEIAGGLVCQDELRAVNQSPCDGYPLLLPS